MSTRDHETGEGVKAPSSEQTPEEFWASRQWGGSKEHVVPKEDLAEEQPWSVFHSTSGPLVNGCFVIDYTLPEPENEPVRLQDKRGDGEGGEVRP